MLLFFKNLKKFYVLLGGFFLLWVDVIINKFFNCVMFVVLYLFIDIKIIWCLILFKCFEKILVKCMVLFDLELYSIVICCWLVLICGFLFCNIYVVEVVCFFDICDCCYIFVFNCCWLLLFVVLLLLVSKKLLSYCCWFFVNVCSRLLIFVICFFVNGLLDVFNFKCFYFNKFEIDDWFFFYW